MRGRLLTIGMIALLVSALGLPSAQARPPDVIARSGTSLTLRPGR
jgi:hypothetical protein